MSMSTGTVIQATGPICLGFVQASFEALSQPFSRWMSKDLGYLYTHALCRYLDPVYMDHISNSVILSNRNVLLLRDSRIHSIALFSLI